MHPTGKTRGRYRWLVCVDCDKKFLAGARGVRCLPCNDAHRRAWQRERDAKRPKRAKKRTRPGDRVNA
jgi:hypothetical protein